MVSSALLSNLCGVLRGFSKHIAGVLWEIARALVGVGGCYGVRNVTRVLL